MKALTIRSVPDEVYVTLKKWAKTNHRSMQEQVKHILEQEVQLIGRSPGLSARDWREQLKGRNWGNIVDDIRGERNR